MTASGRKLPRGRAFAKSSLKAMEQSEQETYLQVSVDPPSASSQTRTIEERLAAAKAATPFWDPRFDPARWERGGLEKFLDVWEKAQAEKEKETAQAEKPVSPQAGEAEEIPSPADPQAVEVEEISDAKDSQAAEIERPKLCEKALEIEAELVTQRSYKSAFSNADRSKNSGGRALPRARIFAQARFATGEELVRSDFRLSFAEQYAVRQAAKADKARKTEKTVNTASTASAVSASTGPKATSTSKAKRSQKARRVLKNVQQRQSRKVKA